MATIQSKQLDDKDLKGKGVETKGMGESKNKRRYPCSFEGCNKAFQQQAHLRIHLRCHSGEKPFVCGQCGKTFAQLGNLKTHQRRHTGEKPYICTYTNCGKKFAQKGNLRAHKLIHEGARPYVCRLDNCTKTFTQLGNLKVHQNKFHNESICRFNAKLKSLQLPNAEDEQLLDYFLTLYRYSNQGIKGRGKEKTELPLKKETESANEAIDASSDFSTDSSHLPFSDKMGSQTMKHENLSTTNDIDLDELLELNQEKIEQLIACNKLEKNVSDDLQDNLQNTLQELEQINVRDLLLQLDDPSNLNDMAGFS
ncbi:hypothetical protein T552_01806 [Pneumocystis carinii B80]|uniref:C2H2-type domain-containing protein n=1 Tax=Pneumocystis carinii (strain B80) TaxID=1408658 RepID=A0A0W4ZJJ6_PNEC8|nr:hypothetical protein T552_01806 [Pneumocystis carinii B80]KTW28546.1 hypothetical protein T552_01806 [Pneumocystis carinii B80]